MPAAVTKMLPSTMKRFFTSWLRPRSLTTDRAGSVPIRAVTHQMPTAFRDRRFVSQIVCPCGAENLAAALDGVVQHAPAVLAHPIGDLVILGAGMPSVSFSTGSSATVLCSSGRSSQIAATPVRWQNSLR